MLATILYLGVIFSFIQGWFWLAGILTILFSLKYDAVYLIPAAIVIDGYFGNYYTFPMLSISLVFWYLIVEFLRPNIMNIKMG